MGKLEKKSAIRIALEEAVAGFKVDVQDYPLNFEGIRRIVIYNISGVPMTDVEHAANLIREIDFISKNKIPVEIEDNGYAFKVEEYAFDAGACKNSYFNRRENAHKQTRNKKVPLYSRRKV